MSPEAATTVTWRLAAACSAAFRLADLGAGDAVLAADLARGADRDDAALGDCPAAARPTAAATAFAVLSRDVA